MSNEAEGGCGLMYGYFNESGGWGGGVDPGSADWEETLAWYRLVGLAVAARVGGEECGAV